MSPFRSKSQMRKFFSLESQGKIKKGTSEAWAKETPDIKSLPMRISNKRNGGYAGIHIKKNNIGSRIKRKMARYAIGGEVGGREKEKKRTSDIGTGTGQDKEKTKAGDLKLYDGTMTKEDSENMIVDGKPYKGKVYTKKEKPTPSFIERKADGGEVEGEGTGTSDSVPAKVKKGSFIIPVSIKNKLRKLLSKKSANLNQGGGIPVNLSKGEQVLMPNDAKKIDKEFKRNGIKQGINILAPKARTKFSRKNFIRK